MVIIPLPKIKKYRQIAQIISDLKQLKPSNLLVLDKKLSIILSIDNIAKLIDKGEIKPYVPRLTELKTNKSERKPQCANSEEIINPAII